MFYCDCSTVKHSDTVTEWNVYLALLFEVNINVLDNDSVLVNLKQVWMAGSQH